MAMKRFSAFRKQVGVEPDSSGNTHKEKFAYDGDYDETNQYYHGAGRLENLLDNSYYQGEWVQGRRDGFGTQVFGTGEKYQGAWQNDLLHGLGTISYPDNSTFQGEWNAGHRSVGKVVFGEGYVYNEVCTGSGPGRIDYKKDEYYIGEVLFEVVGRYTIPNVVVLRHGYGEMVWKDKRRYIGYWKDDACKGFGVFLEPNGVKYYGFWSKGTKYGFGVEMELDGSFYEGIYERNIRKGRGKLVVPSGDSMKGDWNGEKVSGAYTNGTFADTPRPIRTVFTKSLEAIRRAEETVLFTSDQKWIGFFEVNSIEQTEVEQERKYTMEEITKALTPENDEFRSQVGLQYFYDSVTKFIQIFETTFTQKESMSYTPPKNFILQTAIEDINSFLASSMAFWSDNLGFGHKQFYGLISEHIFSKIYDTLFSLYCSKERERDLLLSAKFIELEDVTMQLMGVKKRFLLEPDPSEAPPSPPSLRAQSPQASPTPPHATNTSGSSPVTSDKKPRLQRDKTLKTSKPSKPHHNTLPPETTGSKPHNVSPDAVPRVGHRPSRASMIAKQDSRPEGFRAKLVESPTLKKPVGAYQRVIEALEKLTRNHTPITKSQCLIEASNKILQCVDEFTQTSKEKKEPIAMGAEDKFPILIYAIIKADVPNLWCHFLFLRDFLNEFTDEEVTYRTTELGDAIQYILTLDWQIRDQSGVLSPLLLIESTGQAQMKGLDYLAIPNISDTNEIQQIKNSLVLSISHILRKMSRRTLSPHEDFVISKKDKDAINASPACFDFCVTFFEHKDIGLKISRSTTEDGEIMTISFVMKHPLHVYARLSEVVIQAFYS